MPRGPGGIRRAPGNEIEDNSEGIFNRIQRGAEHAGALSESEASSGRRVVLYRNGFVVDDGPLRDFHEPANTRFLNDLMRGVVPTGAQS